MLASGNTVVFNAHPSGARIAAKGVGLFNRAIREAIGIDNLLTIVEVPTLETAQQLFDHREVKLICVTGGPAVARAALRSPKRAIVAGPGNPPVVVDETADLRNASVSIIAGAAYDNNLLCIGEKEVFAVSSIFDELMEEMSRAGAVRLDRAQTEALTRVAFQSGEGGKVLLNKDLVGKDAAVLARAAGFHVPEKTELLFAETSVDNPFVDHEQMMPFVPFVRASDVNQAIALAKKYEHGYKHTAVIHSRNVDTITHMGREMDTTLFVQNGPSTAGLGSGGEGYLSFSIATPTGEGVTTPLTFTRQRRSTTVKAMRVL
jgi:aldehyde dehydrogenase